jgi:D-glycero-alpha-D-manno-heptose-7-phosphate kinase
MIITRSPLRLSLGGGGTDLPSYYRSNGGFVVSAALDKHVYVTVHEPFTPQFIIKYSKTELVDSVGEIQHPIIREALRLIGRSAPLEVVSMSDIPAGTGLGSSGAFTTALLKALHRVENNSISPAALAEQACHIEIERLEEPVGKQDQYVAAFGGISAFTFHPSGEVSVEPLRLSADTINALEDNVMLFFTGFTRSAGGILAHQDEQTRQCDPAMLANLDAIKQIGREIRTLLERGDLRCFAELMHVHWQRKRARSPNMTNSRIDDCYEAARRGGALGGKLVGAGGGGFLMLYTEDRTRLRRAMTALGLREVRIRFDFEGAKVVAQS